MKGSTKATIAGLAFGIAALGIGIWSWALPNGANDQTPLPAVTLTPRVQSASPAQSPNVGGPSPANSDDPRPDPEETPSGDATESARPGHRDGQHSGGTGSGIQKRVRNPGPRPHHP